MLSRRTFSLLLLLGWPALALAQGTYPFYGAEFPGVASTGEVCFIPEAGKGPIALTIEGKGLDGKAMGRCEGELKEGLVQGLRLVLLAQKPAITVELTLDDEGTLVLGTITPDEEDRREMKAVEILREAKGRAIELREGSARVTIMRIRDGFVQSIQITAQHHQSLVAMRAYAFFGKGLSRGPSQRSFAVSGASPRKGRIIQERYNKEEYIHAEKERKEFLDPVRKELLPFLGP